MDYDLTAFMSKRAGNGLSENTLGSFARQLVMGTEFLHSHRIIHRDLKPANILIDETGTHLKITDFGLSRLMGWESKLTPVVVTLWYRAPEVLLLSSYSSACDIWAVGCIIVEMVNRAPLFKASGEITTLKAIIDTLGVPPAADWPADSPVSNENFKCSNPRPGLKSVLKSKDVQLLNALERLLTFNPDKRCTADEALSMPYFTRFEQIVDYSNQLALIDGQSKAAGFAAHMHVMAASRGGCGLKSSASFATLRRPIGGSLGIPPPFQLLQHSHSMSSQLLLQPTSQYPLHQSTAFNQQQQHYNSQQPRSIDLVDIKPPAPSQPRRHQTSSSSSGSGRRYTVFPFQKNTNINDHQARQQLIMDDDDEGGEHFLTDSPATADDQPGLNNASPVTSPSFSGARGRGGRARKTARRRRTTIGVGSGSRQLSQQTLAIPVITSSPTPSPARSPTDNQAVNLRPPPPTPVTPASNRQPLSEVAPSLPEPASSSNLLCSPTKLARLIDSNNGSRHREEVVIMSTTTPPSSPDHFHTHHNHLHDDSTSNSQDTAYSFSSSSGNRDYQPQPASRNSSFGINSAMTGLALVNNTSTSSACSSRASSTTKPLLRRQLSRCSSSSAAAANNITVNGGNDEDRTLLLIGGAMSSDLGSSS